MMKAGLCCLLIIKFVALQCKSKKTYKCIKIRETVVN